MYLLINRTGKQTRITPKRAVTVTLKYGVWGHFLFLICIFQVWRGVIMVLLEFLSGGKENANRLSVPAPSCPGKVPHMRALVTCKNGIPGVPGWAPFHWGNLK